MPSSRVKYNWVRGESLGSGSCGSVNIVIPKNISNSTYIPPPTAVKSSTVNKSYMLMTEEHALDFLGPSPYIIKCYGHDHTIENGKPLYNIFLEYASGGSLFDHIINRGGGGLPEACVRQYTRAIAEGLRHIHSKGFVHCDVMPENILVFNHGADVKIADFGLAKRKGEINTRYRRRGTPMYMSPESVNQNEYESPVDIWALGCTVVEMISGANVWDVGHGEIKTWTPLLNRIGKGKEMPKIPKELSIEGKDFLDKCLIKDPQKRWTAEMLINHPFIKNNNPSSSRTHARPAACMPKGIPYTRSQSHPAAKLVAQRCLKLKPFVMKRK